MIRERNLAPERGPRVWARVERGGEPPHSRWADGFGGAAMAAVGAALVAAGSGRLYRALRAGPPSPAMPRYRPQGSNEHIGDQVASDSDASFPASDAPSWTPVEGVSPRRLGTARPFGRPAGAVPSAASAETRAALGGPGGIHIVEQVRIARPVAEVYRFWRDLTNLPRFMRHVRSVTTDGPRSHWVVRGPLGTSIEWDAEVNHEVENKLIGWQTVGNATVVHAGSVNFEEEPGGTVVRVKLQYDPPGGRVGGAVAKLLGDDPAGQIREDLQRVKQLLEHV